MCDDCEDKPSEEVGNAGETTEEDDDDASPAALLTYSIPTAKCSTLPARMLAEARLAAAEKPYNREVLSFEGVGGKHGRGGRVREAACFVCADEAKLASFAQEMEAHGHDLVDILPESYGGKNLFAKSTGYEFPALANPMVERLVDACRKQRGRPGFVALAIIGMLCGKGAEVLSVLGDPSNADLDSVRGIKAVVAAVRRVCPEAAKFLEALNQRLAFCGRTGSGHAAPDATNPEGLFGGRCAEELSAPEYRLLEIIFIGCANADVLIGSIMAFGGPASATFRSLAPLATRLGRGRAGADFECRMPDTASMHAKYYAYGGDPLANYIRISADMLASCVPHVAKLNGIESCPPPAAFDRRAYDELRATRLALSAATANGSLGEADIPTYGNALSPQAAKESASKAARDNANKLKRVYYDEDDNVVGANVELGTDGEGNSIFPPPPTQSYVRMRTDRSCVFGGESASGPTCGKGKGLRPGGRKGAIKTDHRCQKCKRVFSTSAAKPICQFKRDGNKVHCGTCAGGQGCPGLTTCG